MRSIFIESLISLRRPAMREAIIGIALVGTLVRIIAYFNGSSLHLDEAMVTLNLQGRDYSQLLAPLDYNQIAPIGWLLLHKWLLGIWPNIEFSLRALSIICGISAIWLIWRYSMGMVGKFGALAMVTLISLSPEAIVYSIVMKPYSSDLFFTVLITVLSLNFLESENRNLVSLTPLLLAGLFAIPLSFPVVFVLAGAGCALLLHTYRRREYRLVAGLCLTGAVWLAFFGILYLTIYNQPSDVVTWMRDDAWTESFAPFPAFSLSSWIWYPSQLQNIVAYLFTDEASFIVAGLYLTGFYALLRSGRLEAGLLIGLPILLAVIVSMLQIYPFSNRLIIYLLPCFAFGAGYGLEFLAKKGPSQNWALFFLTGLLIVALAWRTFSLITQKDSLLTKEDIHPVMQILQDESQATDHLYVYYGALPAFWVYRDRYDGIRDINVTFGRSSKLDPDCFLPDLQDLESTGRVWALFAGHQWGRNVKKEDELFLEYATQLSTVIKDWDFHDVRLVLLDFDRSNHSLTPMFNAFPRPDESICTHYWSSPVPD